MDDGFTSHEDAAEVGFKIIEMVDRLKVADACAPGAIATWALEVDDVRYTVKVQVARSSTVGGV